MSRRSAILQDYGGRFEPMTFEGQIAGAQIQQRTNEANMQNERLKATAKQKEGADATKFITELKNEKTGINDIDVENDKQLLAAQNKMIDMMQKGAPLTEIQIYAMRELPKINNAYTVGKNYKDQFTKGMVDLEKKYGNGVDLNAAQERFNKMVSDDLFQRDDKGNITGYKDPATIPKNRDYIGEMENDEEALGTIFKPSGALSATIKKLPTPAISKSEDKRGKDGRTRYNGFTGQGSVFVEEDIDPETGITKGLRYKSEKVPLGNNPDGTTNFIEVMPEDEFGLMTETPAAKKDFNIMFNEYIRDNDGDPKELDPRAKDILKRSYALQWVKETNIDGSAFNPKMKDIQPLTKNTTNINNRSGGKDITINDVSSKIDDVMNDPDAAITKGGKKIGTVLNKLPSDAFNVVVDLVNSERPEDSKINPDELFLADVDGERRVYRVVSAENGKQDIIIDDKYLVGVLPRTTVNTKVNTDTKRKEKVLREGEKQREGKAATFNVVNPTTGKVVMSGVDESTANKAKAKGYKIQ